MRGLESLHSSFGPGREAVVDPVLLSPQDRHTTGVTGAAAKPAAHLLATNSSKDSVFFSALTFAVKMVDHEISYMDPCQDGCSQLICNYECKGSSSWHHSRFIKFQEAVLHVRQPGRIASFCLPAMHHVTPVQHSTGCPKALAMFRVTPQSLNMPPKLD